MGKLSDIAKNQKGSVPGKNDDRISAFRFSELFKQPLAKQTDQPLKEAANPAVVDKPAQQGNILDTEHIYSTLLKCMQDVRNYVKNNNVIDVNPALSIINKIVASPEILSGINPVMFTFASGQDYYILQPVHTMIYALNIGLRLNYQHERLMELGLAALLQNVGMFLIPDDIVNKSDKLTDEEIQTIKKHPEMGRDILLPLQKDFPAVIEAVYQHHERESGQGYPQGLKGEQIAEYAKIIGICDSYEAMTHNRPHKKALLQFNSVRQLIEEKERLFSPRIIKVFLEEMSLYPVGSYVKLNNGAIGMVIKTNHTQPVKPLIRIIFDGLGNRAVNEDFLDMSKTNVLNIVDAVAEGDMPE
jgi:HD-GYP domain-containing protein (c-di-GMP phosphodiesterase class II)